MFLNEWDDFSQLAGSCPSGGFFGRAGSSFCAPGVAGMLGFEIFGAQRLRVRGFWRTEVRGGARARAFHRSAPGGRDWVGISKNNKKKRCLFLCVFFVCVSFCFFEYFVNVFYVFVCIIFM